ncbi:metal ABC transporter solute-binding protein, Zn/Mn family [Virgibacillus sp. W0430]|uniref:metal ABC transporter solute-binding protein, Zn/Mn family n=1 Tax=Virgibacillus sp. W0430 TaxID=3391580 RepID=UPI003F44F70D
MIRKQRWSLFFLISLIFTIAGCTNTVQTNDENDSTLTIYTSIYPIQYAVEQIAGEVATVKSVYPPGVDAHTFEPTSKEITDMANANMFIFLGAGMESFTSTAAEALDKQNIVFVELANHEALFSEQEHSHHDENDGDDHEHDGQDPHIWLDPLRMIKLSEIVKQELIQLSPEHEQIFTENFVELEQKLHTLDGDFKLTLEQKINKDIIVAHAAYGYWEERYGINQIAVHGLTSGDEPSQKDLTKIAKKAKENNLNYVIFEQTGSDKVTKIIQEYIQAEPLYIHNLEVRTEQDIQNHYDYLSIMRENLDVLDQATQ